MRIERASFDRDAWPRELFAAYAAATPRFFLVAEIDGHIAGYSIATFTRQGAEIDSLAVLPRYRNLGVATALLKWTIRKVRRRGVPAIALMVRRNNESAIRLYRKLGFVRAATVANYYPGGAASDGALQDTTGWRMRKTL
jgi:ribosomal-protein-alanine N-acetyltransferase